MANYKAEDPEYWEGAEYAMPGIKSKRWAIGTTPRDQAWAMQLQMDPGFVIARHCHNFDRFEVIVKGTIHVGDRVYGPGDVMLAQANEFYGPKVCGPEGCSTLEFFAREQEGDYLRFELEDGSYVLYDPEGSGYPEDLAQKEWIEEVRSKVLAEAGLATT